MNRPQSVFTIPQDRHVAACAGRRIFLLLDSVTCVSNRRAGRRCRNEGAGVYSPCPLFPVPTPEIGALIILPLLDHLPPDRAGAGEQVEQRVPVA